MSSIHKGYMGYANIGGTNIRFGDANITVRQDVNIPDLVMGHFDRGAYNYGKIEIGGTISGPVTENFADNAGNSVWDWAYNRDSCGALTPKEVALYYFCDAGGNGSRTFPVLLANSVNFSCAAGDVAQFSIEVIGADKPSWGGPVGGVTITDTEKLVTWDNVGLTITSGGVVVPTNALLSSFDFTVANNCEAFWALGSTDLYPVEIVSGLRTITGSISAYDPQAFDGVDSYGGYDADSGRATMSFNIGNTAVSFKVSFHRSEPVLNSGAIISTIGFTGTGIQP